MAIGISCGNPPHGQLGVFYTHTFPVTGLLEGETYTIAVTGTLPPGLTLDVHTGVLSGTPTHAGTYSFTLTVNVDRGTVETATLNVTTSLTGACTYPAYESPLVGANGIVNLFAFLFQYRTHQAADGTFPKRTDSHGVMAADLLTHPELAFNPLAQSLIYPVDFENALGPTFSPGGIPEFNIYGATLDVTRADASSGTLHPRGFRVIGTPTAKSYVLNPEAAVDDDDNTYATIHHDSSHLPTLGGTSNLILEIGTEGWVDPNDTDDITCSITIIGPNNILDLWVWRELFTFAGTDQVIAFPPGYEQPLRLQLAAEFGRHFPGHDLRKIKDQLARALERIDRENVTNSQAIEELPPEE